MQYPPALVQVQARSGSPIVLRARLALGLFAAGCFAAALSSCALYDDTWEGGCILDCEPEPEGGCAGPADCAQNETCGGDAECHPGNCSYWGCVDGYSCVVTESRTAECVLGDGAASTAGTGGAGEGGSGGEGGGGTGGATGTGGEGGTGAGGAEDVVHCGAPDDCGDESTCDVDGACQVGTCDDFDCIFGFVCDEGQCVRQNAAGCSDDEDCGEAGERCVSGICTAPADLCFDGVQCRAGSSCADGKCVPSCTEDDACPEAYECDTARGICSIPAIPCDVTDDCDGSDAVCVDGACVPRVADGSGGDPPTCDEGEVWVDNGCIPDQAAIFSCSEEGVQAECADGLLCVHRTCFVPCAPPDEAACDAIPGFENCADLTAETGSFEVCAADGHLGGDCDPSRGIECDDALVCVDGTCR